MSDRDILREYVRMIVEAAVTPAQAGDQQASHQEGVAERGSERTEGKALSHA